MKVLIACEHTGCVRDEFLALGHDAISCDFLPTDIHGPHYQGNVFDIINDKWDLMIAFPPCTYLAVSGLHWNGRVNGREAKTQKAVEFVKALWNAPINKIALENPVGCINTRLPEMPHPQTIQPYEFGDNASKKTCLWLKGLPPLKKTQRVKGRFIEYCEELPQIDMFGLTKERWSNQLDTGQNNLPDTKNRALQRSKTYPGIAKAMAEQWGGVCEENITELFG